MSTHVIGERVGHFVLQLLQVPKFDMGDPLDSARIVESVPPKTA